MDKKDKASDILTGILNLVYELDPISPEMSKILFDALDKAGRLYDSI